MNKYSWIHELESLPEGSDQRLKLEGQCPKLFGDENQKAFIARAKSFCTEIFVVDPEIDTYVNNATIIPRVVDSSLFEKGNNRKYKDAFSKDNPLIIVHAPSRPFIKGTNYILDAIQSLKDDGCHVELKLIQNLSNQQAVNEYSTGDLLIDQLRIGWYGVLSVECMAMGLPVMSYVRDDLSHYLPNPAVLINVNPDNLKSKIRMVYDDPDLLAKFGKNGHQYSISMHHPVSVARYLGGIYLDPWEPLKFGNAIDQIREMQKWLYCSDNKFVQSYYDSEANLNVSASFYAAIKADLNDEIITAKKYYNEVATKSGTDSLMGKFAKSRIRIISSTSKFLSPK